MIRNYLLDRIEEAVLVIDQTRTNQQAQWLAINAAACQRLGCQKEDFLQHATAHISLNLHELSPTQKATLRIEGGSLFEARLFQFECFEDTYEEKACWVLIGGFLGQGLSGRLLEERLLEKAMDYAISDAIIIGDQDLHIQSWNQAASKLYGWSGNEAVGRTFGEVIPTIYLHEEREEVFSTFYEKGYWEGEVRQQHSDGSWLYIHAVVNAIKDAEGRTIGIVAVNRDITTRRETEQALKASEERLKLAGKAAYDLLYEWEPATGTLTWFGDIDRLLGFPAGTISYDIDAWLALIHPEDQGILEEAVIHHATSSDLIAYEYRVRHADGHYLSWSDRGLPLLDEKGKPIKWIGICSDRTSEIQMINKLQESDKLLTIIGENFPKAYLSVIYSDFTIGYTNGQEFKLQGIDPNQFVGLQTKDVFSVYGEEVVQKVLTTYAKTFQGEQHTFELHLGGQIQQYTTVPIENDKGEINSMLAVVRNVTEEREKEIRLQESEEKFSKAFREHAVPMTILHTQTGKRVDINDRFIELTGYKLEELNQKGMDILDLCFDKSCMMHVAEQLNAQGNIYEYPVELVTKQGQHRHLLVSGAMMEVGTGDLAILSLVDITDRLQHVEAIKRQNKLLKNIAWMQSHEVRAPLTNIMGLIVLLELDTPPSPEEEAFIHKGILQAAHDLDGIIRKIVVETEEYWGVTEEIETKEQVDVEELDRKQPTR